MGRFWSWFTGRGGAKVTLLAPISGEIQPLENVPDPTFSTKMVGDGVAIDPTGGLLVAPVAGVIHGIAAAHHAFSMRSHEGIELFVHCGVDTVLLKGEGFTRLAQVEQQVEAGTPILGCDLTLIGPKAKSLLTVVIISNMERVVRLRAEAGRVVGGESPLLQLQLYPS